jgi:hypothetical protein
MESDILFEVLTPLGFRVRVTRGYWEFIVTVKHPVMRERTAEVQDVLHVRHLLCRTNYLGHLPRLTHQSLNVYFTEC